MGSRIFLRTSGKESRFRDYLNRLIRAPEGDHLVLCSGYIYHCKDMAAEILNSIKTGCSTTGKVTLIAGKLGKIGKVDWEDQYRNFAAHLKNGLTGTGISLEVKTAPENNWHAKIAFKLKNETPLICLLGSSNLTKSAYNAQPDFWSYEGDILIWDEQHFSKSPAGLSTHNGEVELDLIIRPGSDKNEASEMLKIYKSVSGVTLNDITNEV